MRTDTPKTIYLKDYQPPVYQADHIDLNFDIRGDKTIVRAETAYRKADGQNGPLVLNGENLKLVSIEKDGTPFEDYTLDDKTLVINDPGETFTLSIVTEIDPASNTALEGLYKSGDTYCTQCEAEGFRRITYYQDRPDVMATFSVRVEADKETCPVLLSNGNLEDEGDLENGRHYTLWNDPTPKPCYLFALVAGDLVYVQDEFQTAEGRNVDLRIYVRKGDEFQCDHAMRSLIKSMKWDEDVYGRIYQYDRFNIVAVSDFNMGAMENTSLNIFNTALVLAHPDTATDTDFIRVESVIAHEYFHNWTGNRITCRDWFQLSLKEGLTVFRDQEFSADMNSRAVQRIDDVQSLRRLQFPEDAGPLAHPVRPDNYIEINNFYTMTVYEKGAEVIRMFHTLLGPETYRKATDLYFDRFDGQAVTCDDWAKCMEDASGMDLSQFKLWYSQAGTPEVSAKGQYDEKSKTYSLTLSQAIPPTPGQSAKKPMHIPVKVGLVGPNGDDMTDEQVLNLTEPQQTFTFENIGAKPVPSILRNFSAPVKLHTDLTDEDLRFLMVHDSDGFNRWESGQKYFLRVLNGMINEGTEVPEEFLSAYGELLDLALSDTADKALMARAISIPDISRIAQEQNSVDPDSIHAVREKILNTLSERFTDQLEDIYQANRSESDFEITAQAMGQRVLKNTVMLIKANRLREEDAKTCLAQYNDASNMTDRMGAFYLACALDGEIHDYVIGDFYSRFKSYPLVIDKWFSAQSQIHLPKTMNVVRHLKEHPDFNMRNPNRVRALYGAFAMNNPVRFHAIDGSGYDFLTQAVKELNSINPQIAARLLTPLREWKRFTPDRQEKMKNSLQEIANLPNLSPDVYEIVSKSLNA